MHPSINGVPTNRPTNQATTWPNQQPTKQPTNHATKPHNSVFSPSAVDTRNPARGRLDFCIAGEVLRPPHLHSIHPTTHPSPERQPTDQPTKQQRGQTNKPTKQPTNQATKANNKQTKSKQTTSQAAKQAEPINTPTKGRRVKKERVGSPPAANKPSEQTFSPNAVDTCFALVAHQATNKPSLLHSIHLCVHACIHPRPPLFTDHPSTHPSNKQATNKPSNPNHTTLCFHRMLSILGLRCWAGAAPSPAPPPAFIYTASINPSIHPSTHPSTKHTTEKMHVHQALYHASNQQQANQATNAPKSYIFLLVHDHLSLYVFSPNPSNQQAKQAEPTNTPTKGSGVKKKGRVAHQATSKPSNQTVSPKCCRYSLCIGSPPSNKQNKQPKPRNPLLLMSSSACVAAAPFRKYRWRIFGVNYIQKVVTAQHTALQKGNAKPHGNGGKAWQTVGELCPRVHVWAMDCIFCMTLACNVKVYVFLCQPQLGKLKIFIFSLQTFQQYHLRYDF